jgi:hypothetical protein
LQHASVIDLWIMRGIQQSYRLALAEFAELGQRRTALELTDVAPAEGSESLRVVLKPLAQRSARGDVLHPQVHVRIGLFQAPGPEAIH